jgi:hypothetical protein
MALALANLMLAAFLCGLIWFVGVVHYPLFAAVGEAAWPAYGEAHRRRTAWVVAAPMLAQLPVGLALVLSPPAGDGAGLPAVSLACALVAFGSTALVFAPAHGRLATVRDPRAMRVLVRGNWLRVAAWTAQSAVAAAIVLRAA